MKIAECGFVYMITCLITGKIYIGSSIDPDDRFKDYNCLDCKRQRKLYNSFNKYGINNHLFEIVWAGLLLEMRKYETLIGWGFNVLEEETGLNLELPKLGDTYICKIVSENTKQKLRDINLGKKASEETKNKMKISSNNRSIKFSNYCISRRNELMSKIVLQYNIDLVFIKEWNSAREAWRVLKIANTTITKCCRGKVKTAGGFIWKYKN